MNARLNSAEGVGTDSEGKTFIADLRNKRIRMVDSLGTIVTVVGTGQRAIIGVHDIDVPPDGTPGTFGNAGCPAALAVGTDDRVYYAELGDRKSTRLNSSHGYISYAVFCLKKKKKKTTYV